MGQLQWYRQALRQEQTRSMKHLGQRPQSTLRIRVQTLSLTQYSWKGQFGILIVAATEEVY